VLTSDQKGAAAEAAIAYRALRLGIGVARPLADQFYDLIFDLGHLLVRVQCKWARARKNQQIGIRWASDYEFDAKLRSLGAVAQLGERQSGTLEATGSSPVGSTAEAASSRRLPLF
jgi:hypothetical protein